MFRMINTSMRATRIWHQRPLSLTGPSIHSRSFNNGPANKHLVSTFLDFSHCVNNGDSFSPIDGKPILRVKSDSDDDYEAKRNAALACGEQLSRSVSAHDRASFLLFLRHKLTDLDATQPLKNVMMLETGKNHEEINVELSEVQHTLQLFAGAPDRFPEEVYPSRYANTIMKQSYIPKALSGHILPFNFPVSIAVKHLAASFMAGVPMILKASEYTSISTQSFITFFKDSISRFNHQNPTPIPTDCVHVVHGGAKLGQLMANDPHFQTLGLTGSSRAVKDAYMRAATNMTWFISEGQGNNPIIVMPSAVDDAEKLNRVSTLITDSAFKMSGQRCTSARRLFIHERIFDTVLEHINVQHQSYLDNNIGHPENNNTIIGPLTTKQGYDTFLASIEKARHEGAAVSGGSVPANIPDYLLGGYYVEPALIDISALNIDSKNALSTAEVFGPRLLVDKIGSLKEGCDRANSVPEGLYCSVFTNHRDEENIAIQALGRHHGGVNIGIATTRNEIGARGFTGIGSTTGSGGYGGAAGVRSVLDYLHIIQSTIYFGK